MWPGSFAVPRKLQEQTVTVRGVPDHIRMLQLASRSSRTTAQLDLPPHLLLPDAEDELIPNAAAVTLLLKYCTYFHVICNGFLTAPVQFGPVQRPTDGVLKHKLTKEVIFAILEIKGRLREKKTQSIIMQETREVVGWLMSQSLNKAIFNHHFLVVSQDRHHLYLSFFKSSKDHHAYLRGEATRGKLMKMQTFGP
ncbi:hypothetical protein N7535_000416 [Penicillium sp. DV-2018c]|nr:hypothetical protein N7461_006337 [Penicillium sp. DV-2018c]KAJ5581796.1 hypothetical protein N7535_000416 [Penicillium sp. DV-2018c]